MMIGMLITMHKAIMMLENIFSNNGALYGRR